MLRPEVIDKYTVVDDEWITIIINVRMVYLVDRVVLNST